METTRAALPGRRLGRSGLTVSALGLGGAGLGGSYGELDDDAAIAAVHAALDGGITYIDTSPLYGESERRLGLALGGGLRDRAVLSTKVGTHPSWPGDYSATATYRSVESSLRLLCTDRLDLVLVHDPPDLRQALGRGGAVDALEDLKRQGVVGAIGLGVRDHALHAEAIRSGRVDAVLTFLDYTPLRTTAADTLLPLAQARDVGVINGSPLAMGLLSGANPDELLRSGPAWAAPQYARDIAAARRLWRWAREHDLDLQAVALQLSIREPRIATTIVGAKSADEVRQNLRAAAMSLPVWTWDELERARRATPEESA